MRFWYSALVSVVVVLATAAVPAMTLSDVVEIGDERDKSEDTYRMRMQGRLEKAKREIVTQNDETFKTSEQENKKTHNLRNKKVRLEDNHHPNPSDDIAPTKRVITDATTATVARQLELS